ncbi:MAG: sulfotransferase, partial [Thermoguttaceae bacterium]
MTMRAWFSMLTRQHYAVSPTRWSMAVIISMISPINSALAAAQKVLWGKKIREAKIEPDPIFIVGHWRSGTTLLHELLVLDQQFTYPNTYTCFTPEHFLVSRYLVPWWLKFIMPSRRPMDNMEVSWERPQEDEFALCNMGIPSPYLAFAFPNVPGI